MLHIHYVYIVSESPSKIQVLMTNVKVKPKTLKIEKDLFDFTKAKTGKQDISNLSLPKSKSREFLWGQGVEQGKVPENREKCV